MVPQWIEPARICPRRHCRIPKPKRYSSTIPGRNGRTRSCRLGVFRTSLQRLSGMVRGKRISIPWRKEFRAKHGEKRFLCDKKQSRRSRTEWSAIDGRMTESGHIRHFGRESLILSMEDVFEKFLTNLSNASKCPNRRECLTEPYRSRCVRLYRKRYGAPPGQAVMALGFTGPSGANPITGNARPLSISRHRLSRGVITTTCRKS